VRNGGDGEGVDSETLSLMSYTLKYISLTVGYRTMILLKQKRESGGKMSHITMPCTRKRKKKHENYNESTQMGDASGGRGGDRVGAGSSVHLLDANSRSLSALLCALK